LRLGIGFAMFPVNRVIRTNAQAATGLIQAIQRQTDATDRRIDERVDGRFGLTDDQIRLAEGAAVAASARDSSRPAPPAPRRKTGGTPA